MRYGYDKDKNFIDASDALKGKKYHCPMCGAELVLKQGDYNIDHFAHKSLIDCDAFSHDMSKWHKDWQNMFPVKSREIVISLGDIKHRADVCLNRTVIEFQHSSISEAEFHARNEFYTKAGFRVIWLFDLINEFSTERIKFMRINDNGKTLYQWLWSLKTLSNYKDSNNIQVFFQEDEDCIELLSWTNQDCSRILMDTTFDKGEFISYCWNEEQGKKYVIAPKYTIKDVSDKIIEGYNKMFYPCFICEKQEVYYEKCWECKYFLGQEDSFDMNGVYFGSCFARFTDIHDGWNDETDLVKDIVKDVEGRVLGLRIRKNGEEITREYAKLPLKGKTIRQIIATSNASHIAVVNLRTGSDFKIGITYQKRKTDRFYGNLRNSQKYGGRYQNISREIYYADREEWILTWENSKSKDR